VRGSIDVSDIDWEIRVEPIANLSSELALLKTSVVTRTIRKAIGASANRCKMALYTALSGEVVYPRTGRLREAVSAESVRALPAKRGVQGVGIALPTRAALGIPASATHYYPAALEYGTPTMEPKAPFRGTINRIKSSEQSRILADIAAGLEKSISRALKRAGVE